jgi:uncharacterized protein YndB with AHSA1/START domain
MATRRDESPAAKAERTITITRLIDAPRTRVWQAWVNPAELARWWGPTGFKTTIEIMDVRPGGVWRQVMHGPDGTAYPSQARFSEVLHPERIVFTHTGGRAGAPVDSFESTWTFEAVGEQTRVTISMEFQSAAIRNRIVEQYGAIEGGQQTLARLASEVSAPAAGSGATGEFVISRLLAAPRELVFRVFTERDHLLRWWGPKGAQVQSATLDLRPGGSFHYSMQGPGGATLWGKFVYREIVAPERIVFVNSFSDASGGLTRHPMNPLWPLELLSTITYESRGSGTLVTVRWQPLPPATPEERAAFDAAHANMQQGWSGTFEQLAEYLLQAAPTGG